MDKHEIAKILDEIATLLSLQGENPFKIRAYQNAARAIEGVEEDLQELIRNGKLEEIPGIGESIAQKVTTLVQKGHLPYYEKLKKSIPKGLLELLAIRDDPPDFATEYFGITGKKGRRRAPTEEEIFDQLLSEIHIIVP